MIKRCILCILLALSMLLLAGCSRQEPLSEYEEGLALGYYPTGSNFPNTEWHSREIDMTLYITEHGDFTGTYTDDNGIVWRISTVDFIENKIYFELSKMESLMLSSVKPGFLHADFVTFEIAATYIYKDNVITCDVYRCHSGDVYIPNRLTFEKAQDIPKVSTLRLYAEELNMYIDWNPSIDGIMNGQIVLNEKICKVSCAKISESNFYSISIFPPNDSVIIWYGLFEFENFPDAKITFNDTAVDDVFLISNYPVGMNPVITFVYHPDFAWAESSE